MFTSNTQKHGKNICAMCGTKLSSHPAIKCDDGCFCKSCAEDVPKSLFLQNATVEKIKQVIEYERNVKENIFDITASYGKLYLDEMRGYIILTDHHDSHNAPVKPMEMYALSDIDEIGIYPVKPRVRGKSVLCDVEFACLIDAFSISVKKIVKTNVNCKYRTVSSTKVEWSEPGDLTIFRSMIEQGVKASVNRTIRNKVPSLSPYDIDVFQAESALMLPDGYTKDDVRYHADLMVQAFNKLDDTEERNIYCQRINEFRKILNNKIDQ